MLENAYNLKVFFKKKKVKTKNISSNPTPSQVKKKAKGTNFLHASQTMAKTYRIYTNDA